MRRTTRVLGSVATLACAALASAIGCGSRTDILGYAPSPSGTADSGAPGPQCGAQTGVTVLASGQYRPANLVLDSTRAYWSVFQQSENQPELGGAVMTVSFCGGTPTTLASAAGQIGGMAVSATALYWTEVESLGNPPIEAVVSVPLSGGTPTTLFSERGFGTGSGPTPIAVDHASVYWTEVYGGKIMKLTPK